tara:strand:+ start:1846 stop:2661 length:816 start_codon:yes stop_codon:yes gene_type:complete
VIAIKSFGDQDQCRSEISKICARFALDAISLIDGSTSGDFDPESPEAKAYLDFREWLGPELVLLAQASIVSPVLSSMRVDGEGYVYIHSDLPEVQVQRSHVFVKAGRIAWLCAEIPSLDSAYGELYEDESEEAARICKEADALDLADEKDLSRADELLPRLEELYRYAQPGFRIYRGDKEAIAHAESLIEAAREKLRDEQQRRIDEYISSDASGEGHGSLEAVERFSAQLNEIDLKIKRHSKDLEALSFERNKILDDLELAEEALDASKTP